MIQRPTSELLEALNSSDTIQDYLKNCHDDMVQTTPGKYLSQLALEKHLSKSDIFKNAEINEIYGYQIFSDTRTPSRDKLLCLCIGMQLEVSEAASLLKYSGYAPLYPRIRRDSIVLYGLLNHATIYEINEWLYDASEKTLY